MPGEPNVVGIDRADGATLDIGALGGDHRITNEAHWAFLALQFGGAGVRQESAVGEQCIGLIDVQPLDRSLAVELFGEALVDGKRGEHLPAAMRRGCSDLAHALKARQKNRALHAPGFGGVLAWYREKASIALHDGSRRRIRAPQCPVEALDLFCGQISEARDDLGSRACHDQPVCKLKVGDFPTGIFGVGILRDHDHARSPRVPATRAATKAVAWCLPAWACSATPRRKA